MNSPRPALPRIAIVGRPNVGKSFLFNRLLGRRRAIVHRAPGMTLDFLAERLEFGGHVYSDCDDAPPFAAELVDTGGVAGETDDFSELAREQMERASAGADFFVLAVDAKSGLVAGDVEIADWLRRRGAAWLLAVNKAEGLEEAAAADFYGLGAKTVLALSAKTGGGVAELRAALEEWVLGFVKNSAAAKTAPPRPAAAEKEETEIPKIAIVGRPNVGKSTFTNRLLGGERMAVSPLPGTTRDVVSAKLQSAGGAVILYDTAGMRRKRADTEREKFTVAAARALLPRVDVAFLLLDLAAGATHQDKRIAALVEAAGCGLVVVGNKADLLPAAERAAQFRRALAVLAPGIAEAAGFALSATSRRPLPRAKLLAAARAAAAAGRAEIPTARLNQMLARIVHRRAPKRAGAVRPKLRYAHQGGSSPLSIVLHGNAVDRIDQSYRRYLSAAFARELAVRGAPVKIVLRGEENPYV